MSRLLVEVVVAELRKRLHEIGRRRQVGEALGKVGAVALGETGDQVFLRIEVDVERSGADQRLLAEVLHRRAVKARARKADLGGIEDVLATSALRGWFELGHRADRLEFLKACPKMARNKTNDRFVCTLSWRVDGVCNGGDNPALFSELALLWRPLRRSELGQQVGGRIGILEGLRILQEAAGETA